jgi:hypothetical protein
VINPATSKDQIWPIGRFAIGEHHIGMGFGDDDVIAVQLDVEVHAEANHKRKGGPARSLGSRLAINVRTTFPARRAVGIEGAMKIFPCQIFEQSLGVFSHQSSELAWV